MNRNPVRLQLLYPVTSEELSCLIAESGGHFSFHLDAGEKNNPPQDLALQIETAQTGEGLCRDESGRVRPFAWGWVGPQLHLWLDGDLFIFQREDVRRRGNVPGGEAPSDILAPMPGAVLEVMVKEGDRVERNQTVMLMESMKMELAISSPRDAVVRHVAVQPGQQVERGMRLLELAPESDAK